MVAHRGVPLLPKLRGQFAEFLRHRSLKHLGMLNQPTCVGFGYGPIAGGCFQGASGRRSNPIRTDDASAPSPPGGPGTINPVPIGYGSRPRLRGRLTLRGLALRRNPWASGDGASHPVDRYSCQHARFRCLQRPSRDAFAGLRNAPLPRPTPAGVGHPQLRCVA